ncbi:uroporphyrinogen-III C-methyltransferase [Dissulfurispira sp.]|uniref:uroporphyrinogen-III C-methyltransferase n=1 Tax=Dissulfurispira sp. TaxID=2817609 RepID=UPI002FD9019E
MKKGKVYLIGAGPGDVGLLTVKGLKCLQKAEAVVYDFHLNAQILNYINHDAEFIYAGKRGGHHAMTQDEINQALVNKANEGKIVCRLKGGDPFVFGRGGEEAEVLVNEGIEFEVIPGVSSSIAAPAYAGIPLTHRKYSSSFAVITGNEDITKPESSIDWSKFANGFDTLVFLMGVKNIGAITSKLIEHGKSPDTPVAVVRWGTRPDQKTVVSTLKDIAGLVKEENIKPPAVMVVGNVVKLRDTLKWYENKPLFGQRILITREYTKDYEPLEDLGAEIFEFPTIETVPPESYKELDESIDKIETYNWIIFTSANGFKYFMQRLLDKERDIRDLKGVRICAIGTKTAETIKNYGVKVDLIPEEFTAEGLIEAFSQQSTVNSLKEMKFLLPRAEVAREVFPQKVRELGGEIDTPAAYRAIKPEKHGKRLKRFLKEGRISVATFTSAATFNNFVDIMGEDAIEILKDVTIAVIGPVTAKAIEKAGLKVSITPKEATIKAMVDEIIKWATKS